MNAELNDQQRERVEQAMLRVLRARYPGRLVSVEWDQPDTVTDGIAARVDDDRREDAA